jgi:hypothetical protein
MRRALALFLLTACGGAQSSPEGAVRSFLDALEAQDTVRFREAFTPETWVLVTEVERLSREIGAATDRPAITIEDWCRAFCGGTVEGSTLLGDAATVRVQVDDAVEEIPVVRVEDEWRLDLEERYAPAVEMLRLVARELPDTAPAPPQVGDTTAGSADTLP